MKARARMWKAFLLASTLAAAGTAHAGNNAAFVSQSVPAIMMPSQTYPVSVTMQNNGTTTWTPGGNYKLGSQNPQDNMNWGMNRIYLAAGTSIAPGGSYTFSFTVTSPATPGNYNFSWRMVQDGVEWFGVYTANVLVKNGPNNAAFVSQNVPTVTVPGQMYPVSVTMLNTGGTTWTAATQYRLGSQNPTDNYNFQAWRPSPPHDVAPGQSVTFSFNIIGPTNPGTYNFQWRMLKQDLEWFGAQTTNIPIKNGLNDAAFVSQVVPTVMMPGQSYPVSVTLKNTGGSTWTPGASYKLGSQNPQDNNRWGAGRIYLPAGTSVAPGANYTFTFYATAPTTPGTHNFQWRMVRDGYEWFGATSPNVPVKVGLDYAEFVSQNVPTLVAPGQTYPVTVTMRNTGTDTWAPGTVTLGSQNPQDNTTWGFNRVPLSASVAPGQNATFNFSITAPTEPGQYNVQWRLVDGDLGWFGPSTPNVSVQNGWDDAQFVSQDVPTSMNPGQSYPVSVTMQNTGTIAWAPGTYRLGSQHPVDNSFWGVSRVELASAVAPGANATFAFTAVAPAASGPYNFQWRMLKNTGDWFGASSANIGVTVGSVQANMYFIQTDHLNTPRLVANAAGQTVWLWHQSEPFGNNVPDENPSGLGIFDLPLRLPGQYFDKETNLQYNYFRNYDPSLGRYEESDPIGLNGGLNTYAYGLGSPLGNIDPLGLDVYICTRPVDVSWIPNWASVYLPPHTWIKTDTYESGMGGNCPIPGQQCSDKPYSNTTTTSHAGQSTQPNSTCVRLQNVSERCVNNLIKPGSPTGTWSMYNQCQSFAWSVTAKCRYGPQIGPVLPNTLQQRGPLGSSYGP